MQLSNEIVLRPRFQIDSNLSCEEVLNRFRLSKKSQKEFNVTIVDNHFFVRLPKDEQFFWSPQLHLEVFEEADNTCNIHGFFGPNPTVWTMFMFFHVVIGMLFVANLIWLYSNSNLKIPVAPQIGIAVILVVLWFVLYLGGTIGKKKGKTEIQRLYGFMLRVLED